MFNHSFPSDSSTQCCSDTGLHLPHSIVSVQPMFPVRLINTAGITPCSVTTTHSTSPQSIDIGITGRPIWCCPDPGMQCAPSRLASHHSLPPPHTLLPLNRLISASQDGQYDVVQTLVCSAPHPDLYEEFQTRQRGSWPHVSLIQYILQLPMLLVVVGHKGRVWIQTTSENVMEPFRAQINTATSRMCPPRLYRL